MEAKFTTEELQTIQQIQQDYHAAGISLVQLQVYRTSLEKDLQALKDKEDEVRNQILAISEREMLVSKQLSEKYGVGTLNMETGTFTSQK